MPEHFDLFVIGAGPGGYPAAIKAAKLGMKVALAEREAVGGTCLNKGCIPTKALLHSAGLYREIKNCERYGLKVKEAGYDINDIYTYKEDTVEQLRKGTKRLIEANGVTFFYGNARIMGANTEKTKLSNESPGSILMESTNFGAPNFSTSSKIEVTTITGECTEYEADNILIATGSQPMKISFPGDDLPGIVNSDDILATPQDMKQLIIIGGGVIGVEFASIFSSLGCEVTIIEAMPSLLANLDREISQNLKMIMKKRRVNIYCDALFLRAEQKEEGEAGQRLVCHFKQKDKELSVEGDKILVAVGRKANIEELFEESLQPKLEKGKIIVDENFMTDIPHVYAVGDVIGGIQLAHLATAQGIAVAEHIKGEKSSQLLDLVPSCIYTDPEIACVGLTQEEAKKRGIRTKTSKSIMSANGKSLITKEERGFIKLVFEEDSKILLGAQLMCARATDMVGELATAIANKLDADALRLAMRPHPTYQEAIGEAIEDLEKQAIHIMPGRAE